MENIFEDMELKDLLEIEKLINWAKENIRENRISVSSFPKSDEKDRISAALQLRQLAIVRVEYDIHAQKANIFETLIAQYLPNLEDDE
jgi:hypothetical protein